MALIVILIVFHSFSSLIYLRICFLLFFDFDISNLLLKPLFGDSFFNSHWSLSDNFSIHLLYGFLHLLFFIKPDVSNSYTLKCLFISDHPHTFNSSNLFKALPEILIFDFSPKISNEYCSFKINFKLFAQSNFYIFPLYFRSICLACCSCFLLLAEFNISIHGVSPLLVFF